jgi:hypothetical protein
MIVSVVETNKKVAKCEKRRSIYKSRNMCRDRVQHNRAFFRVQVEVHTFEFLPAFFKRA